MVTRSLADVPRGAQRLLVALVELRSQGYDGAHYDTLAALLGQHVRHVKASAWAARDAGLVTVDVGGGRARPSVVKLTPEGAALVPVPSSGRAGA